MNKGALIISVIVFVIMLFFLLPVKGNVPGSLTKETLALALVGIALTMAIFAYFLTRGFFETVGEKVASVQNNLNTKKAVETSLEEYQKAKRNFNTFSNADLQSLYIKHKAKSKEDMVRLALEEELLSRGLISSSPMLEKANRIMKNK